MSNDQKHVIFPEMPEQPDMSDMPIIQTQQGCSWCPSREVLLMIIIPILVLLLAVAGACAWSRYDYYGMDQVQDGFNRIWAQPGVLDRILEKPGVLDRIWAKPGVLERIWAQLAGLKLPWQWKTGSHPKKNNLKQPCCPLFRHSYWFILEKKILIVLSYIILKSCFFSVL